MDTRPGLMIMLLDAGVIGPLMDITTGGYSGRMADIRTDTLGGVRAAVVLLVMVTLECIAPVSYATEVWSGTAFVFDLGVSVSVDANMCAIVTTCFEFTALLTVSEELLLFRSMATCC